MGLRWLWLAACLLGGLSAGAHAQGYPTRPIRLVVPFAAGGATDVLARLVGAALTARLGKQVVVDNRPGAGGNIGCAQVAKAAPDGYTLLMGAVGTHAINPSIYRKLPYDPVASFAPVTLIATVPNVLVVAAKVPAASVPELIALAEAKRGALNFASSGNGTSIHLSGELFKTMAGVEIVHVPYRGSGPAVIDLLGGQVEMMFDNLPSSLPHIRSGRLRALGVTSARRSPALPDVPTIAEAALPGYEAVSWFALFAPAGTPGPIVARLNEIVVAALQTPQLRQHLADLGAEPAGGTQAELAALVQSEIAKWAKVVADAGIKLQ